MFSKARHGKWLLSEYFDAKYAPTASRVRLSAYWAFTEAGNPVREYGMTRVAFTPIFSEQIHTENVRWFSDTNSGVAALNRQNLIEPTDTHQDFFRSRVIAAMWHHTGRSRRPRSTHFAQDPLASYGEL